MAIYAALLALLWFYSDYQLEQYALSASSADGQWIVVALGWEIVPVIWPAVLLMMVAASAMTLFVSRRLGQRKPGAGNTIH
jgi:hypothetical protein